MPGFAPNPEWLWVVSRVARKQNSTSRSSRSRRESNKLTAALGDSRRRRRSPRPFARRPVRSTLVRIGSGPILFGLGCMDPAGLAFVTAGHSLLATLMTGSSWQWREMRRQTRLPEWLSALIGRARVVASRAEAAGEPAWP